ncbi:MAG TPA: hypothetical protein VFW71_14225 [Actinomycetota bacterium]|nr:hypothetical protein [Actinomycetota bacterium]
MTPSTSIDWGPFYEELALQGNVPDPSSTLIERSRATLRAMYLDLAVVQRQIQDSGFDPPLVVLYADVVDISAGTSWLLANSVLFIAARRIQTDGPARITIDYRTGSSASLVVYAAEVAGSIDVTAVTGGDPGYQTFVIDAAPPGGGVQIAKEGDQVVELPRTWAQGMAMSPEDTFVQALVTEFIFASLLYDSQPSLALAQFLWLKNWSAESPDLWSVFFRSSSLLSLLSSQINAAANGAAFVPYLTRSVYTDLASSFVAEASKYESDYRTLSVEKVVTDNFIELAKTLLANQTYQTEFETKLLAQAKANYDNAVAAVTRADKTLKDAQLAANLVAIDFQEIGIPDWERKKILEAVIDLASAVITFGVGIGLMLVGDEAGGAASAGAAVEGAKAAASIAEAGSEIARVAKELAEVMEKLKKVIEALNKVYEFAEKVVEAAGKLSEAKSFVDAMKDMDVATGGIDLSGTYEWQVYQLNADAALQGPLDEGVGYAKELKVAVDTVAIYGQALAAAQLAAVTAGQQYATVALQKELAEAQQAELQAYVDRLQVGEAPIVALMQAFYQRYLDAKSSLYAAIQGYRASYYYWALQQSSIQPKIIDTVDGLDTGLKTLTAIALDQANALQHFDPPPQAMVDKQVVIDDPVVLAALRETGACQWNVPLEEPVFDGFDRVRLSVVRMWLEGAVPGSSGSVDVAMGTYGNGLDRYQGLAYQFTSQPLRRAFQYRVSATRNGTPAWRFDNGTYGYIEVDGRVDDEVKYAYFEPTAFGQWQINLTKNNPGLNLSGVTKITMQLQGSVIPDLAAQARRQPAHRTSESAGRRR